MFIPCLYQTFPVKSAGGVAYISAPTVGVCRCAEPMGGRRARCVELSNKNSSPGRQKNHLTPTHPLPHPPSPPPSPPTTSPTHPIPVSGRERDCAGRVGGRSECDTIGRRSVIGRRIEPARAEEKCGGAITRGRGRTVRAAVSRQGPRGSGRRRRRRRRGGGPSRPRCRVHDQPGPTPVPTDATPESV